MKRTRFDCVELQHRGGERLMKKLEKMTIEERVEYFRQRTAAQRELQRKLRAEAKEPVHAEGGGQS